MATSEADLWKTFANKLMKSFTVGQDIGPKNRIYIPLLNSTTIPAGNNVSPAITNYGVARVGDSLLNVDNPMFVPSTDTYAKRCLQYLRAVYLITDSSIGSAHVVEERKAKMDKAEEDFFKVQAKMKKYWEESGDNSTFVDWVSHHSGTYSAAKKARDGATAKYFQALTEVDGVGAQDLLEAIRRLEAAIGDEVSDLYNMEVSSERLGSTPTAAPKQRAPKYVIDSTYAQVLQNWASTVLDDNVVNGQKVVISFDSTQTGEYSWESLGHTTNKVDAKATFLPFFRVEYAYKGSTQRKEVKASEFKDKVGFELSANGLRAFSIGPDSSWDPGNVQKRFQRLFPNSPPSLSEPMVMVTNIVVGWKVAFKITMGQDLFNKITSDIEEASKHDANASATLFGFRLGLTASGKHDEGNSTKWSDVQKNNGNYEMVIPASTDNTPVLLAAFGTVLSKDS
ncbi:hypothetical protein MFIFM68171_02155 [Madurella fahalii]|uniref:Uncharacterized protein n=1 Tax=Madurella fahalii TaxID=1157608 RepID=A0ABQ0G2F1_9PEZI